MKMDYCKPNRVHVAGFDTLKYNLFLTDTLSDFIVLTLWYWNWTFK